MTIIAILAFLIILLICQELFRQYKWISWFAFLILPVVLLPWWIQHAEHSIFGWIKIYSVVFGASWVMALRFTSLKNKSWAIAVMYLILVLNILEAVVQDVVGGRYLNYLNAITGILLIVTLPGTRAISVDLESRNTDLLWELPKIWIIVYSIWNIMFIHQFVPQHSGMHIAVLGSALIVGLIDNRLWLQARAFTLGTFALLFFTYKPMFDPLRTPSEINEPLALVGVSIGLGWMIVYMVSAFFGQRAESTAKTQV